MLLSIFAAVAATPCAVLLAIGVATTNEIGGWAAFMPLTALGCLATGLATFGVLSRLSRVDALGPKQGAAVGLAAFAIVSVTAAAVQSVINGAISAGSGLLFLASLLSWYPAAAGAVLGMANQRVYKQRSDS